jgi:transcriptional regulator with XRE-family HTH domain
MDMRKLVGRNVRRIRLEKRLTQEQFAEQSGFTQQYLSGLERGRRNPTIVSLYEIALALGVEHVALVIPDDEAVKEEGRRLKPDGNEMNVLRTHAQVRHPTKSVRPRAKQVRKES